VNVRILGTDAADAWLDALARLADSDAYFLPAYHRACELNGDGEALAFVAERGGNLLVYPFLVRPIRTVGGEAVAEPWCDLESVYGYTGPLATTADEGFLADAWREFGSWCEARCVVAEFVRFDPMLANEAVAVPGGYRLLVARESVVVPLAGGPDEVWQRSEPTHRNKVRKARRAGLSFVELEDWSPFLGLYGETMERLDAERMYRFSDAYFDHLRTALGGEALVFAAALEGEILAAALFLRHADRLHYHLAGSTEEGRRLAATNLLLAEAASWASAQGLAWLHLGGGHSGLQADSLLRFKASLSPLRRPVHVGTRIRDESAYESLCDRWSRQRGGREAPPYFLRYRLDPAA
jgi:hypothetical protein